MRLRSIQKKMKKSHKNFARILEVSPSWLSSYYYGKILNPGSETCERIIRRVAKYGFQTSLAELRTTAGRGPRFDRYA
jgi:transcriptional regulator with XRE-family HTH domain